MSDVGRQLADLEYRRADGTSGRLSELWSTGAALLVWLRHTG